MQVEHPRARGQIAEAARAAWTAALGHDDFDATSSFFRVGGHSMLGAMMVKRLGEELGTTVPARVLFDHPGFDEFVDALAAGTHAR